MKYGCIGEHLKHSFSKEIHTALANYEYEIREVAKEDLDGFMKAKNFLAINVTIPYKELVLPYMDYIDGHAKEIGSVNTVVNRDGKLYGYNTDFYGMSSLIEHANVEIKDKKVVILGTGGTSKTARAVSKALLAKEIITVSRKAREGCVTYEELHKNHSDAEVIINTTPVGMFPNIFDSPVDISDFKNLAGVIDAVYNPLRTPLILAAKEKGIYAEGGLYMLVKQAVRASEIFIDTSYSDEEGEEVFEKIKRDKENIVLIGMPASGKTTVGKILAGRLRRQLIDTDDLITLRAKKPISRIFEDDGEKYFRALESEVIKECSSMTGVVIATGGGAVLSKNNVSALRENGRLYFLDRPLEELMPTSDRPLASTREAIQKRYKERYEIYRASADEIIDTGCNVKETADKIERIFSE